MVLLAASIAAVIWAQDELLFPTHAVGPPGPLPRGAERIIIDAPGSIRLHGVHIAPATAGQGRTLVLGFGGNAWNGDDVGSYLHRIYPHADVSPSITAATGLLPARRRPTRCLPTRSWYSTLRSSA